MLKRFAAVAACLYAAALVALATGSIDTTDADISASNGGTVTIDPCATGGILPAVPTPLPPPPLGSMTDSMGSFGGAGAGGLGAFSTGNDLAMNAGTYEYSSYTVSSDAVVSYSGPTTLLVSGDMTLRGSITVPGNGGGLTIRVGGDLSLIGGDEGSTDRRIEIAGGNIRIEVFGTCRLGDLANTFSRAAVRTSGGGVTILAFGNGQGQEATAKPSFDSGAALLLADCQVDAPSGSLILRSALGLSATGNRTVISGGSGVEASFLYLQAFGGDLVVENGVAVQAGVSGTALVEASGGISLQSATVTSDGSDLEFGAFGGDLAFFLAQAMAGGSGGLLARSSGDLTVDSGTLQTMNGPLLAYSTSGNVCIGCVGSQGGSSIASTGGSVTVRAAGNVDIAASSSVTTGSGPASVDAEGSIAMSGSTVNVTGGQEVAMRAGSRLGSDFQTFVTVRGSGLLMASRGINGVRLDAGSLESTDDGLEMLSIGSIVFHGSAVGEEFLDIVSTQSDILVSNADLRSADFGASSESGPVSLRSFDPQGHIDASGSTIRSGAAETAGGDVSLLVYSDGAPPPVQAYFLPKKLKYKRNTRDAAKSVLTAAGFLDTGPGVVDLSAPATLSLGGLDIPVPGLTAKGTSFLFKGQGLTFVVKASKVGSSRAVFKLKHQADFGDAIDPDGDITLRFDNGTIEGIGTVRLEAGKFALGKKRGSLTAPNLYPAKSKVKLLGGGKDGFTLVLGLATGGTTPNTAPDLTLEFGGDYVESVDGAAFTRSGDRWTYRGTGGITSVVLDYLKETVTVKAKNIDLGNFIEGSQPVRLAVTLGTSGRSVEVRMGRKGKGLKY